MMSTERRLALDVAGLTFQVNLPDSAWRPALVERYQAFLTDREPAWQVDLHEDAALSDPEDPWIEHRGDRSQFHVPGCAGWLDLASRQAEVRTQAAARAGSALDRVLVTIGVLALPRSYDGLLLHAVGIEWRGAGYVFCGPSGAGKTTVARLAQGVAQVLCDENVVVRLEDDRPWLHSTPFWGHSTPPALIARKQRRLPLQAIYFLRHAPDFAVTRLLAGQAITALLLTEKVATERVASAEAWLAAAQRLIDQVPVYQLDFRPQPELWQFLQL